MPCVAYSCNLQTTEGDFAVYLLHPLHYLSVVGGFIGRFCLLMLMVYYGTDTNK